MSRLDYFGISFIVGFSVFCLVGLLQIKTNTEDVLQWLPDQSNARADYDVFEAKFGSDDFLIVTWEDCTTGDSRLSELATQVRQRDSSGLIRLVTTGGEIAERLKDELNVSRANIEERLRGIFFRDRKFRANVRFYRTIARRHRTSNGFDESRLGCD